MARKDKCTALYEISMIDFLLMDMQLYLDTHPNDKNALEYYRHYAKYGPLFATQYKCSKEWEWSNEPNAWEGVC